MMSSEAQIPTEVIVAAIRMVYTTSCPMLSINKPFAKGGRSQDAAKYIKQFWASKKRNKIYAQNLLTINDLVKQLQAIIPDSKEDFVLITISDLVDMNFFWLIDVDTKGANVQKLLLTPLGLALWQNIDQGALFNLHHVSDQYIRQNLSRDLLLEIFKAEKIAWVDLNYKKIAAPQNRVDQQAVCIGLFLLLNSAIDREHALHLTLTEQKDYKHHETLTKGLEVIAEIIFERSLFTAPSLKDDLQRRHELIRNVGASFKWMRPKGKKLEEYYWWEIGDYHKDTSTLDYIVQCLIYSMPMGEGIEELQERLKKVVNYFVNKVGYQLSVLQMSALFSKPAHDFEYALEASIDKVIKELPIDDILQGYQSTKKLKGRKIRRNAVSTKS